jgi:Chlorophyll A-B binding protein
MIYHYTVARTICLLFTIVEVTNAFVLHDIRKSFSLASTVDDTVESEVPVPPRSSYNKMSQALPFLKCPPILAENMDVPGNVGFDPLGFAQDKEDLITYQEAEIKHARLAMLV